MLGYGATLSSSDVKGSTGGWYLTSLGKVSTRTYKKIIYLEGVR